MSKPRLSYFDMPVSRGEECRLAFVIAGVDFDDHRIARADWPAVKPTTPFGTVPVLEIEGHAPIGESNAILQYIGRRWGVHPTGLEEAARHEALLCAVEGLRAALLPSGRAPDETAKRIAREEFAATTLKTWAAHVEAQLGDGPFVGGATPMIADVKLYMGMRAFRRGVIDHIPATCFDACPKLIRLYEAFESLPAVKAWITR